MEAKKKITKSEIEIIPPFVDSIEDKSYRCNHKMRRIMIPKSVHYIGWHAFEGCHYLEEVYYEGTAKDWAEIRFQPGHGLFSYGIENGGTGTRFFVKIQEETKGDVDVDYNDGVLPGYEEVTHADLRGAKYISDFAFEKCRSIQSIDVTGVQKIGAAAFSGCVNLSGKLDLSGVEEIRSGAFEYSQISEITVPLSVTTLQGCPFAHCHKVDTINCEAKKRPNGWDKIWDYRVYNTQKFNVKWKYKEE